MSTQKIKLDVLKSTQKNKVDILKSKQQYKIVILKARHTEDLEIQLNNLYNEGWKISQVVKSCILCTQKEHMSSEFTIILERK